MVILRQHWLFELTALCESLVRGKEPLATENTSKHELHEVKSTVYPIVASAQLAGVLLLHFSIQ